VGLEFGFLVFSFLHCILENLRKMVQMFFGIKNISEKKAPKAKYV
jgi:hypothetical protein